MLEIDNIRASFPAIGASPDVLLDNAGGSQVPRQVHDVEDGVVRVSMLHYNTLDEIDGLIERFEDLL